MKNKFLLPVLLLGLTAGAGYAQNDAPRGFAFAQKQTDVLLKETAEAQKTAKPGQVFPRSLDANGGLALINSKDWCSGFFPGELWYLYQYTKNEKWLKEAETFTALVEKEKDDKTTHDTGFKIYCSVGNAYKLTHDARYKAVIIDAAKSLSTRFSPTTGTIKSWDNRKEWKYPVIIDNMMNLELLFEASKLSGDSSFYKIAVTHANTTMKNHFRDNYSSFHVIDYDPETGKVLHKQTHQGYADGSSWARGQAWGLYGYTMCYRETKNKAYLKQAENIAKYIMNNPSTPADLVPYWDYNDPGIPKVSRDVSAAAITASALYELSMYSANAKTYKTYADKVVKNLTDSYEAKPGESRGFILLHSTGNLPSKSEIDVPINYADYYYLEALLRQKGLFKY